MDEDFSEYGPEIHATEYSEPVLYVVMDGEYPVAFYRSDIHDTIPASARQISQAEYDALQGRYKPADPIPGGFIVSAAQAFAAMDSIKLPAPYNCSLAEAVEAMGNDHPSFAVRNLIRRANVWEGSNPYVWGIASEFNLSDNDVIALFEKAANIQL